jgi:hypothetical protein
LREEAYHVPGRTRMPDPNHETVSRSDDPGCLAETNSQDLWRILDAMMIRSSSAKKCTARRPRKNDDLLALWLDLLKQVDNPAQRRAARLRRLQRPRRQIPTQRLRLEGYGNQPDTSRGGASQRRLAP